MDSPATQRITEQPAGPDAGRGITSARNTPAAASARATARAAAKPAGARAKLFRFVADVKVLLHQSFLIAASFLPEKFAYGIVARSGRVHYRRGRGAAQGILNEIKAGLGIEEKDAERVLEKIFEYSAWRNLEFWRSPRLNKQEMEQLVELRGLDNLRKALAKGKGAILCTGHIRSLIPFFLAMIHQEFKVNAVRRNAIKVQGTLGRWLVRKRSLIGSEDVNFIWMNAENLKAAVQVAQALRRNELVVFTSDVRHGAETIPVEFLRKEYRFPTGHVPLAQATGAPLVNYFMYHQKDSFRQCIEFDEPIWPTGDPDTVAKQTFARLEENIVKHPADWVWFSERELWKNPND